MSWKDGVNLVAAAALASSLGGGPAHAGDAIVKGVVTLPPHSGPATGVVVYIEGPLGTPTPTKAVVDQKDMTFVPHVVAVVAGGTVEFLNSDSVLHNVFSTSAAKHFDLGLFAQNESRSVTFDQPGVVDVRCNVHPKMRAFVVVLENNHFATPDARGNFQIAGVPAGRYKLRAWHETLAPVETWVNLEEARLRAVEMRFRR